MSQPLAPPRIPAARPPPLPPRPRGVSVLNPAELERFRNLLVFAQATVEGYFVGKHKSPYRGSSAEFADYQEYSPGDDLGHLDWRVYGRSRRLFVRRFEEETDMVVYLVVDRSASMDYGRDRRNTKFLVAAKIAAALAYLMLGQGDKAALATFANRLDTFLPPGGTRRHLHRMVSELESVQPASTTGLASALADCVPLFKKRGRLVILSDFLMDRAALLDALGPFLHRKFEILLLQVVDPDEVNLPAVSVAKFVDMETEATVQVEPEEIRAAYRETVEREQRELAREANARRIQHALVSTERPYLEAIEAYLGFRQGNPWSG